MENINKKKISLDEIYPIIKEKIEKLGLGLGMIFSDAVMTALDAETQQIRAEKEEN